MKILSHKQGTHKILFLNEMAEWHHQLDRHEFQ